MFYEKCPDQALRFGDILKGFVLASANIVKPDSLENYKINVSLPKHCVVLSPCCSIGERVITLSPLIQVRASFFDNPYFSEDLTRINRKMKPEESVAPDIWKTLPAEEKQKRLAEGIGYALYEIFIYQKHDLFTPYCLDNKRKGKIETNYYMVDFRYTCKLNCEKIISPKDAPLESKCLQLSIEARSELRQKIAHYYSREPIEDRILQD